MTLVVGLCGDRVHHNLCSTMSRLHHIFLVCLTALAASIVAVDQTWGELAMPQRQADVAMTGLQAGNFSAFTDGVVSTTIITLQDLSSPCPTTMRKLVLPKLTAPKPLV